MPDKLAMRLGGLILAGGRSRRMGRPKESLPICDTTMLGWQCRTMLACTEVVVAVGREPDQQLPQLLPEVDVATDELPGEGPLAAIAAGLRRLRDVHGFSASDAAMAVGCDQPFLTAETVRWLHQHLGDADLLMPRAHQKLQPLTAIYRIRVLDKALEMLDRGVRRPRMLAAETNSHVLEEPELRKHDSELRFLSNLNHPEDYELMRRHFPGDGTRDTNAPK